MKLKLKVKLPKPMLSELVTRRELMSAFDDLKAAIANEKAQAQEKLKALSDRITTLEGQVLTPEQVETLKTEIAAVIPDGGEPTPEPTPEPGSDV